MKEIIHIEGMSCQHCVRAVEGALLALPGVEGAKVDLENHLAEVHYDPQAISLSALKEAIEEAGYEVK